MPQTSAAGAGTTAVWEAFRGGLSRVHALLATVAFALAVWHLLGAGRYLDSVLKRAP